MKKPFHRFAFLCLCAVLTSSLLLSCARDVPSSSDDTSSDLSSEISSGSSGDVNLQGKLFITPERKRYQPGDLTLTIPRLEVDDPVGNGTTKEILDQGVCLYEYAQLPSDTDCNVSIAGHRNGIKNGKITKDAPFYYIDTLTDGDYLYLQYEEKIFRYLYEDTKIVEEDDWSPIYLQGFSCLTLTSCEPIGVATHRIVVRGRLDKIFDASEDFIYYSSQKDESEAQSQKENAPSSAVSSMILSSAEQPSSKPLSSTGDSSPSGSGGGAQSSNPSTMPSRIATQTGIEVYSNENATVDASNSAEGYLLVKYTGGKNVRIKVQVSGNSGTYTYNLNNGGSFETFPLNQGNGSYTVTVYENTSGSSYAVAYTCSLQVSLRSGFLPYLYPNQYVNFAYAPNTTAKAASLAQGCATDFDIMSNVYHYVVNNISYDHALAASVSSGYLPNVENTLATKKGICFDYAALMTAMLRSQNIACKLVIGYAGSIYHAWINVYIENVGWIDKAIYFNGSSWTLMDPTFASSGNTAYTANASNYSAKYVY